MTLTPKIKSFLTIALITVSIVCYGQSKTIKGIVLDKNRNPIPGCTVVIKGTPNSVNTNLCGEFKLAIQEKTTLAFTGLDCFKTPEIRMKSKNFSEGEKVIFIIQDVEFAINKDCKNQPEKGVKEYIIN